MVRLPAFGTAVLFSAFFFASNSAVADPIGIEPHSFKTGGKAMLGWAAPDFGANSGRGPGEAIGEKSLRDSFLSLNLGSDEEFGELGDRGRGWAPSVWVRGLPPGFGLWHATPNGVPFRGDAAPNTDQPISLPPETPNVSASQSFVAAAAVALPPAATPEAAVATPSALAVASSTAEMAGTPSAAVGGAASVVTPEPASFLLLGSGLALAALRARARKRSVPQL